PDDGRDRAVDGGRQEVQPLRPSRRDYDPDWLSPRRAKAFHALFGRIGARAKMQFPIHPHMLRHCCRYALANARHDTRRYRPGLATRTSSTRCVTPNLRRIDLRTSGDNRRSLRHVEGPPRRIAHAFARPRRFCGATARQSKPRPHKATTWAWIANSV